MFSMEAAIDPSGDTDVMLYVVLSLVGLCLECGAYGKLCNLTLSWLRKQTGGRLGNSTYPPNLTQVVVGMVWGGILALLGLLVMIPVFGGFGIFWTLIAVIFTILHFWQFFVKKYPTVKGGGRSPEAERRLEQLESLRVAGLMTEQEYQQKRQELLRRS